MIKSMFGPKRFRHKLGAGAAIVAVATAASVLPASGHASFSAAAGFGFQPNTSGGTGLPGSTPPYVAGSTPTIYARVPFEQIDPFNGSDDTTVDVQIVVPAGWTNPSCGTANVNVLDPITTNNTNQPGATVSGWSCSITQANSHDIVHFTGPQVVAPQTFVDSAQWFSFAVTAPSPTVKTAYDGTVPGTEGFIIDQTYASGEIMHWTPSAAYSGVTPVGAITSIATGLKRTVAAPIPNVSIVVPDYTVKGNLDVTKFKATVTNSDTANYSVAGTDVVLTVAVNGVPVVDPVASTTPGIKVLKTGKSATFNYSWTHGSSLHAGDVVDVTACVVLPTGDGPFNRCDTTTSPLGTFDEGVVTTAPTLTSKSTAVKFTSSITNVGTANVLLRSSDVTILVEVNDVPFEGTITSVTDPAKRKLLKPGKIARYNFSSTLPTLFVGDDVHVTTCVNVPGDTNPSDNCSLIHLDILK